jgi:transketolase C-terminal domain/subunit
LFLFSAGQDFRGLFSLPMTLCTAAWKLVTRCRRAQAAEECGAIVTAEEHLLDGGLGSQVARAVGKSRPVPMEFVGIDNTYAESATPDQLMEKYGLTAPYIVKAVKAVLKRKK